MPRARGSVDPVWAIGVLMVPDTVYVEPGEIPIGSVLVDPYRTNESTLAPGVTAIAYVPFMAPVVTRLVVADTPFHPVKFVSKLGFVTKFVIAGVPPLPCPAQAVSVGVLLVPVTLYDLLPTVAVIQYVPVPLWY